MVALIVARMRRKCGSKLLEVFCIFVMSMFRCLEEYELQPHEVAAVANLHPGEEDEAKSLVKSLDRLSVGHRTHLLP